MCGHAAITFYRTTDLLSRAHAIRPEGVPVLWALLGHLGRFGAWPSVDRLCGLLRRPVPASPGSPAIPPRRISADTVQRALTAYVNGGLLERERRPGLRSWVYRLAEPYASQLEGREAPAESLPLKAAPVRPSSRTRAAPSTELDPMNKIPHTPGQRSADRAASMSGGGAPPAPPLPPTGEARANPPPDIGAAVVQLAGKARPVDPRQVAALLAWYAGAWFRRHGRRYLVDRRRDPRQVRELLRWALEVRPDDPVPWVRAYLARFLELLGQAAEGGHVLADATRFREACRPDARKRRSSTPAPDVVSVPCPAELRPKLEQLAGRRAGGL